ncbi:hypothetical protein AK812_SmicGene42706 [Symbiodinium microadriaticum]|uniref:Uncharacterized protein n=1 Tax=Symbiodinium microadriaticum TaxID=2951 RepID=A0A1Q9C2W4_SYMMI|nr:hypothetical protein AK812_SmicGene42706 [Symbiodinium microadriaticum]
MDIFCRGRQKSKDRHEIDVFEHGSFLQCFSPDRTVITDAMDAQTSLFFVVAITASMSGLMAGKRLGIPCIDSEIKDRREIDIIEHGSFLQFCSPDQVPGDQLKAVEASSDLHANSCHLSLLGETFRRLCRQAPTLPDRGPLSRCLLCLTQLTGTQQRFMPQLQQQCTRQQCQAASIIKH